MLRTTSSRSKWLMTSLIVAALAAFGIQAHAQGAPAVHVGNTQITGLPEDWSTHHVVFSNPGTEQDAITSGHYAQWQKIVNDPRYVVQQLKRNGAVQGPAAVDANYRAQWISDTVGHSAGFGIVDAPAPSSGFGDHSIRPVGLGAKDSKLKTTINTDWNQSIGTATATTAINFPAKWSFSTTATASCSGDYVIYPTGQTGSTTQASIIAYYNLYSGCTGTSPEVAWAYNTGATISTAPVLYYGGGKVAFVQTTGSGSVTATTTTNGTSFTVTTGTINASEVGSLVTGTGIPANDTVATVTGTTSGTLTIAATTGGTGTALTITGVAQLVLLSYPAPGSGSGTLGAPAAPTVASASNFLGCGAPCSFTATLSGSPADTWSAPYYDYGTDILVVGDSTGHLHKFTSVFRGTPTEDTTSPWPVQMANTATDTNQLASPVYDPNSGYVFVGSTTSASTTTGGYFYAVNASTGAIHGYSSIQLDKEYGIRDAPLFDPVAEEAYVFAGYNGNGDSAVYQFPAAFTSATTPSSVSTGAGADSDDAYVFTGTFDNTYYTSSSATSPTGNLYVCASGLGGTLYQIPITANSMGTPVAGPELTDTGHYGRCSTITEFYNANITLPAITATGTVTIASNPRDWSDTGGNTYPTVTIGATTYSFVTTLTAANQVLMHTAATGGGGPATNEDDTAQNFEAVINNSSTECADTGCVHSGQAANASVTASYTAASNVVDLTAKTSGSGGNFTLSTALGGNAGAITVSGGSNGTSATTSPDLIFLSNFAGTQGTCTNSTSNGCVMSFNVTTPSSFSATTVPLGTLDVASQNLTTASATNPAAVTSGIIVDNNGATAGQSEIYFQTQNNSATTPCVTGGADGICAIQASQAAP